MTPNIEFPLKLQCLFEPARYKVLYGGRGGAKSWGIARALLVIGSSKPIRVLCAREFQTSIKDSVHKLLSDQIINMGLTDLYEITDRQIRGKNGSEFNFVGLKNNVANVKSYEGVDICWVEEAQSVSKRSWDVLIPTIRKEKSEIWISFNPELETDETYQRFIIHTPANAIVQKINWSDNPWFPEVLKDEKDALKNRDPNAYQTVWEGMCRLTVDGAVFAREMQMAEMNGQITNVPYDATKPCYTIWDLGWADATAIWIIQFVGIEIRVLRYLEDSQKTISHYLAEIQKFGYVYDTHYLPHDAASRNLGTGKSIEEIVRATGMNVRVLDRVPVADSINAARTIFPRCYFDRQNTTDGLQCLRHYRYEVDPDTKQFSRTPLHDQYSHGADAFRMLGLMVQEPRKPVKKKATYDYSANWMG
jgi:phage terminase large subunit